MALACSTVAERKMTPGQLIFLTLPAMDPKTHLRDAIVQRLSSHFADSIVTLDGDSFVVGLGAAHEYDGAEVDLTAVPGLCAQRMACAGKTFVSTLKEYTMSHSPPTMHIDVSVQEAEGSETAVVADGNEGPAMILIAFVLGLVVLGLAGLVLALL